MAFALKQFFTSLHLRIISILDLEPRRVLRRVRREAESARWRP